MQGKVKRLAKHGKLGKEVCLNGRLAVRSIKVMVANWSMSVDDA